MIGDAGVRGFGVRAESGRRWYWNQSDTMDDDGGMGGAGAGGDSGIGSAADASNKLYVGMLIMLIFSEALAL